ncbi:hypothetical protein GGI12_004806 [Dipsacomyces acuminosporus]|nr:hypothetical protein GGI12_004806 [Dipsacomyces acuminosporus]
MAKVDSYKLFVNGLDNVVNNGVEKFARCARVRATYASVLNGEVTELLSKPGYDKTILPSVYYLYLEMFSWTPPSGNEAAFMENALEFCARIKRLFPNLKATNFSCLGVEAYPDILSAIVSNLTSIKPSGFEFTGSIRHLNLADLGHLVNLTRFHLFDPNSRMDYVELICRNASTLEDLSICRVRGKAFEKLIDGVVYPRLKSLNVVAVDHVPSGKYVAPQTAPFPALISLKCTGGYPFDDDILFKGNGRTLEKLRLELTPWLAKIIAKFNVFAQNKLPNLTSIQLEAERDFHMSDELALSLARIPFEIGPSVAVVRVQFDGLKRSNSLMDAIRLAVAPESIRELSISDFKLTVHEVVEIIGKFTNLNNIRFQMINSEAEGADILDYWGKNAPRQTIANMLMVSSLIPSLRFVAYNWRYDEESKQEIRELVADPAFAPYADHLRSLRYTAGMSWDSELVEVF